MPVAYPKEVRDRVIAEALESSEPLARVAERNGISPSCLYRWMRFDWQAPPPRQQSLNDLFPIADLQTSAMVRDRESLRGRVDALTVEVGRQRDREAQLVDILSTLAHGVDRTALYRIIRTAPERGIAVQWCCDVFGVSKQAYYQWRRIHPRDEGLPVHLSA